jgi:hypothetical protein
MVSSQALPTNRIAKKRLEQVDVIANFAPWSGVYMVSPKARETPYNVLRIHLVSLP